MLRILQKHIGLSVLLSSVLFAAQPSPAQSARPTPPKRTSANLPPAPDQAAADRGHALFGQTCGFCHGKEANGGDGGPDLIRSLLVNHDEHGELIAPVVLNGRSDKGMPKFDLTPQQISDISTFLHARNRYVRYRQLYQVKEDIVTGDVTAGQNYFNTTGGCASCHSPTADLAHIANKYDPEALLVRFLYPTRRPSAAGKVTTVDIKVDIKLPSGQSFSGPLKHLDEFTVSMYDSSGDYHIWPRESVSLQIHDPLAAHLELLPKYSDEDIHNLLAYLVTLK
ncbi:MAG TPA: c-type cytochrome [Bryobacteraceae bacterium]|nr:c-type cytochrome [Bryobacteraceae bacterium]